jgi:hypothetical protein
MRIASYPHLAVHGKLTMATAAIFALAHHRDRYAAYTAAFNADRRGRSWRKIDDPAADKRASIVNDHYHGATIAVIGHPYPGAERQCSMSSSVAAAAAIPRSLAGLGNGAQRRKAQTDDR